MRSPLWLFPLVFLLMSNQLFSQSVIYTAAGHLQIAPDARSAGMGEAGVAQSTGAFGLHWNTAGLCFSDKRFELGASYSPWLRSLISNVNHYLAGGYGTIKTEKRKHVFGTMVNFFDSGTFELTNQFGNTIGEFRLMEVSYTLGYALQINDRNALGVNGKYIFSGWPNTTPTAQNGKSLAADISYQYRNSDMKTAGKSAFLAVGVNLSNLGSKMRFSAGDPGQFIPANLCLGSAYGIQLAEDHKLTTILDFNKLLVPTPPIYDSNGNIIAGYDDDVSVAKGWIQSFYDAPGQVITSAGTTTVAKNSRFKEEMQEWRTNFGVEYNYSDMVFARAGWQHESRAKGGRSMITFGLGGQYKGFRLDASYWMAIYQNNPLANTLRFSLGYAL